MKNKKKNLVEASVKGEGIKIRGEQKEGSTKEGGNEKMMQQDQNMLEVKKGIEQEKVTVEVMLADSKG